MKKLKKGFTIVELVIVIAVIAILAAVLIPTFSNVIHNARVSSDTQLVRNLNTALSSDLDEHNTMYDALQAAKEFGYDVGKINASATDNEILWDSENNVFCYLNEGEVEYIPESNVTQPDDDSKLWQIVTTQEEINAISYSAYYAGDDVDTLTAKDGLGLDVGDAIVNNVIYNGTSSNHVVIRTNSDRINVDNVNASVDWYGSTKYLEIKGVYSHSFHAFGSAEIVAIKQGRFVAESTATIKVLAIDNTADATTVQLENYGTIEKAFGGKDDANVNYGIEVDYKEVGTEIEDIVASAIGSAYFAGGNGTADAPYLIENVEQFKNIDKNYDNYAYYKVADGVDALGCSNWPKTLRLHGNLDGNGVNLLNLSSALFNVVGYANESENIVIENFVVDMYNTDGRAFVRNIYNSGTTTFRNIALHGYVEGQYNMGSFYNYGTANLGGSAGADYTVKFENATSDLTLVCTTGNIMGGMLGHGYEGEDYKLSIIKDEASCYTGKMYTTNGKDCYQIMAMCSHNTYDLNGAETSRYINTYASTKISTVNPDKDTYSLDLVEDAKSLKISINVQITAYDQAGNKLPNEAGITWVADSKVIDAVGDSVVVFNEPFSSAKIINNINDVRGIAVENGVLTLRTASSLNYKTGTITLFVIQYDADGDILACGNCMLIEIK